MSVDNNIVNEKTKTENEREKKLRNGVKTEGKERKHEAINAYPKTNRLL